MKNYILVYDSMKVKKVMNLKFFKNCKNFVKIHKVINDDEKEKG